MADACCSHGPGYATPLVRTGERDLQPRCASHTIDRLAIKLDLCGPHPATPTLEKHQRIERAAQVASGFESRRSRSVRLYKPGPVLSGGAAHTSARAARLRAPWHAPQDAYKNGEREKLLYVPAVVPDASR